MGFPVPKTKGQWLAAAVAVAVILAFLYFETDTFKGKAVEVSVENSGPKPIFAYLDDTGRHGNGPTTTLKTTANGQTPDGLLIASNTVRSFGHAVGLGDSPTLHVLPVTDGMLADQKGVVDCAFDTLPLKWAIPSFHVKLRWTGSRCETVP